MTRRPPCRPILPVLANVFDQALEGGGAKNINFQELAADLAEITFEYPFRIPPCAPSSSAARHARDTPRRRAHALPARLRIPAASRAAQVHTCMQTHACDSDVYR